MNALVVIFSVPLVGILVMGGLELQNGGDVKVRASAKVATIIVGFVLSISAISGRGEDLLTLPNAPRPALRQPDRLNKVLWAVDMGLRTGDAITTHQFLTHPCKCFHEVDPIAPKSGGWGEQFAFQYGAGMAVGISSRWLERRGHRKLARTLLVVDIASEVWAVQNNLRLEPSKR